MIDELDRCRPTYALTLLERIKHIFNVNGIVFILAIDRGQLFESIRTVYGSNTDSNRYLRRFLDYRYSLPDPKPEKYPDHLMSVFKHREQFIRVNGGNSYESTQFLETFIALSTCFGMRLRDQEHAFSILNVVWRTLQNNEDINPFILAALLVIKVANEDMYSKLIKSEISVQTLFDYIHQHPVGKTYMDKNYGYAFEAYMSLATESGDEIRVRTKELAERSSKHDIYPNAALKWQVMQPIFHSGMSKFEFTKVVKSIEATNHFKN